MRVKAAVRRGSEGGSAGNIACGLISILVYLQLAMLGANRGYLSALAAAADFVVALAVLILLRPDPRFWRRTRSVWLLFGFALLWVALPAIGLPILPGIAAAHDTRPAPDLFLLEYVKLAATMACVVAGALIGYKHGLMRTAGTWLILLGLAYVVFALALRQSDPMGVFGLSKGPHTWRFTGTFLNANAAGCTFAMIAILAVGGLQDALRAARERGWNTNRLIIAGSGGIAALLTLTATSLTASRSSLAFGVLAIAVLLLIEMWQERRWLTAKRRWATLSGGGIIAIAALGIAIFGAPTLSRLGELKGDQVRRVETWQATLTAIGDAPVYGHGLGAFESVNLARLTPANVESMWDLRAAHNFLLQMALEGGWVLAGTMLAAILLMAAATVRGIHAAHTTPVHRAAIAATLVAIGCASVDIAFNVPAIAAFAAVLGGMAWGRAIRPSAAY